jgi:hypothetical protein
MSLSTNQKRFLAELLASFAPLRDATYLIYDHESLAVKHKLPALTLHPRVLPMLFSPGIYVTGIYKAFYSNLDKLRTGMYAPKDSDEQHRQWALIREHGALTYSQYELYMYWWVIRCMLSERFNYVVGADGLTLKVPNLEEAMMAIGQYDMSQEAYTILWSPSMLLGTYSDELEQVFTEDVLAKIARFYNKFVSQLLVCNDENPIATD